MCYFLSVSPPFWSDLQCSFFCGTGLLCPMNEVHSADGSWGVWEAGVWKVVARLFYFKALLQQKAGKQGESSEWFTGTDCLPQQVQHLNLSDFSLQMVGGS